MIMRVGGIAGVGKTTVISELLTVAQRNGLLFQEAPIRGILRELAGVKTTEEYKALPEETRGSFYPESERRIYQLDRENPNMINIHDGRFSFFNLKSGQYRIRSVQPDERERLLAISVLIADPKTILYRRIKDFPIRNDRHLFDINTLKKRQEKEIASAFLQAKQIGIQIKILRNDGDSARKIAEKLFIFIREILIANQKRDG